MDWGKKVFSRPRIRDPGERGGTYLGRSREDVHGGLYRSLKKGLVTKKKGTNEKK